jgi:hypothetical protein
MTFAIGAAAEAVAVLVVAPSVDRFGRHNIVSLGQLVGGAACIACANVSGGITQAALAAVGKFGCSGKTERDLGCLATHALAAGCCGSQNNSKRISTGCSSTTPQTSHGTRTQLTRQWCLCAVSLCRSCFVCEQHLHRRAAAHLLPVLSHGHLQPGLSCGLHRSTLPAHDGSTGCIGRSLTGEGGLPARAALQCLCVGWGLHRRGQLLGTLSWHTQLWTASCNDFLDMHIHHRWHHTEASTCLLWCICCYRCSSPSWPLAA